MNYDVDRVIKMQQREWYLFMFKDGYFENYKRRKLRVLKKE